jgi:hypothetical protein
LPKIKTTTLIQGSSSNLVEAKAASRR